MNTGIKTALIAAVVSIPLIGGPLLDRSFVVLGYTSGQCPAGGSLAGQDDTADTLLATGLATGLAASLANGGDDPDIGGQRAMDRMFIQSGPFDVQSDRG